MIINSEDEIGGKNVRITIKVLKKHLDQYDFKDRYIKFKENSTRNRRIEKLAMQEKHLSRQFHRIRKEIRRYEKKYEKILKKKVALMGMQVKAEMFILNTLKQKYKELNTHINKNLYENQEKEKEKERLKVTCKVHRVKVIRKLRHKNMPSNRKIKIKIKKNEKLGRREMHFVNNGNMQHQVGKLVNVVRPTILNTRECKITLERLSEEQMNRFVQQENQQGNEQTSTDSLQKSNESETTTDNPNWHIKIPKSVFEEIQKEDHSSILKVTPVVRHIPTIKTITRVM